MKKIFLLLASAHFALGQATVVTCFDGEHDLALPPIGIIPVEDFQKATAEVERLQQELNAVQKRQENVKNVGVVVAEQKKMVQELRLQLKAAGNDDGQQGKEADFVRQGFAQREKALVEKVNSMERERANATERFQKRVAGLQEGFGRKEGAWQRKLASVEEERDAAIRKYENAEVEWKKSVAKWQKEVEQAVSKAQLAEAQDAVANTARLAADWQSERNELVAQVTESELKRTNEKVAWEKSVADWGKKAEAAMRTAQVKEAQEAVANTARLAATWQTERNALEVQVKEMSAKLGKIEGQQKRAAGLQSGFGEKREKWQRQLVSVKEERDTAIRKHKEAEQKWAQAEGEWKESVAKWQEEVEQAVRKSQLVEAQKSVANTARLATDWQAERKELKAQVAELESKRTNENKAWEKSVADWRSKAETVIRTAQVKEAQEAVANTARLAATWQTERNALEVQVTEMSGQLAKLEGQLGVKGFEDKQAEVLRLGLTQKSQALESLGSDAARLAAEWKNEREESRRELDAMRDLYKSTAKDVNTRDQRLRQLDSALMEKNQTLELLTVEAGKLSETWKGQRGGLQKKIANLEKQLAACQGKLKDALDKEKAAQLQAKKLIQENKDLAEKAKQAPKDKEQVSAELAAQLAVAADLQGKLGLAKEREGRLKADFTQLRNEVEELKITVGAYKSQKEADANALAALKAELKQVKDDYAAAERDLASVSAELKKTQDEASQLKLKSRELAGQLDKAREELGAAREEAAANQNVKVVADEKAAQVKNLENQLGRLAVTQQELEGTLIGTLGDFEKLQKSYTELKAKSADGGEVAKKAIAAREVAEEKLQKLQKQLQGEEAKIREARKRVQQVEEKKRAAEADAKGAAEAAEAGKAALGKCEAELQKARSEMGELQLGQNMLVKEAEELRKRFVNIEPVRYQLASANVVAQQQRVLAEVKQVLEVYPTAKFSINGHTCNIGSEGANLKLSEDRAMVLKDFLIENGIEEGRLTFVEGRGDTQPEASNETDEGRRQNRRVEIEVVQ